MVYQGRSAPKAVDFGAPKKPPNAYAMWCEAHRPRVMEQLKKECEGKDGGKGFDFSLISTRMAAAYKTDCNPEEMAKYTQQLKGEKEKYKKEFEEWKSTEKYVEFKKAESDHVRRTAFKSAGKKAADEGKPTRPPSAYFLFLAEHRERLATNLKKIHGDAFKHALVSIEVAKLWKNVPYEERKPFERQARALKAEYETKMDVYMKSESYKEYNDMMAKARYDAQHTILQARQVMLATPEEKVVAAKSKAKKKVVKTMKAKNKTTTKAVTSPAVAPLQIAANIMQPYYYTHTEATF